MKTARRILGIMAIAGCLMAAGTVLRAASPAVALGGAVLLQQSAPAGAESRERLFDWINFTILIVALGYVLRKPAAAFFRQRSETIHEGLEEGRKALEAARAQLEAVEEKMWHLEEQIAAFKAEAASETEAERERLKIAAGKDAERILRSAQSTIESAVQAAKAELTAHAMRQAADMAETMIRERLDEEGRARLVKRFLDGIHLHREGSSQPQA